jgi:hypothetical protein
MSRLSIVASIILALAAAGGPGAKPSATTTAPRAPSVRPDNVPVPLPPIAVAPVPEATPAPAPTSEPRLAEDNAAQTQPVPPPPRPDDRLTRPESVARPESKTQRAARDLDYLTLSPGEVQATPEMWFYEQSLRQYKDSNMAVRRAAEYRAAQRERRIESRRWYGLSNSRPTASPDPLNGDYSPGWSSNTYYPSRWVGIGY